MTVFNTFNHVCNHICAGSRRGFILTLTVITALGGAVRLWGFMADPLISRDGILYAHTAESILRHGVSGVKFFDSGLLFLYCTAMVSRLTGAELISSGIAVNLISGTGVIVASAWLMLELSGSRLYALLTALLVAGNPFLVELSGEFQREMLFLLSSLVALCCAARGLRCREWTWLALAGAFSTMAIYIRHEGLELPVIMVAMVCFFPECRRRWYCPVSYYAGGVAVAMLILFYVSGISCEYLWGGFWGRFNYYVLSRS